MAPGLTRRWGNLERELEGRALGKTREGRHTRGGVLPRARPPL